MKFIKNSLYVLFAAVIGLAYALPGASAHAQTSSALSVNPTKKYVINPGETKKDKLQIRNADESVPLELTMRVIDFTYSDDSGTAKFFLDKNAPQTTWSLRPYIDAPKKITILPGKTELVDIAVTMPKNIGAGSYYSAILYQSGDPEAGGNVGLSASMTTLMFVSVPGKVKEDLTIKKFGAYFPKNETRKGEYRFIMFEQPNVIGYTLENKGNVVEGPVGSIELKDMWGHTIPINNINPTGSLALIGQTRTFTTCIKLQKDDVNFNGNKAEANRCVEPGLWPGMYRANIDIFYGQNGNNTQEVSSSVVFWYLPWWFLLICGFVLVFLSYYAWRIYAAVRGRGSGNHGGPRAGRVRIRKPRRSRR